jgi:RNA polymerase sigma-70 factor (ECF subfamily)
MSERGEASDDELLRRLRSGDEAAFVTLYRRRHGAIYRFALRMSGSEPVAEDVTQEVFLLLIRDRCGYDPARGTLGGYLYGAARKLVLQKLEQTRDHVPLDSGGEEVTGMAIEPSANDPLADLTRRETVAGLREAVLSLPPRYREVVALCDLEEMDYAGAAAVLGCAVGTVRSRLHRARLLLLDKLSRPWTSGGQVPGLRPVRSVT